MPRRPILPAPDWSAITRAIAALLHAVDDEMTAEECERRRTIAVDAADAMRRLRARERGAVVALKEGV